MIGYIYNTESEAQTARLLCDNYYGYPKENCETLHWINYMYSELDGFFYIQHVENLEQVLGEPIEFEITIPSLN